MNIIKSFVIVSVLALSFAVPTIASAGEWFRVHNPGSHLEMRRSMNGEVTCRIPHGEVIYWAYRSVSNNHIFAQWRKRYGATEWDWRDARGDWCPDWNRKGWIDRDLLREIGHPGGLWLG